MQSSGDHRGRPDADGAKAPRRVIYAFGDFELDTALFELRREGRPVHIEPKVLDLILHLVRARDRVMLKKELLDSIWAGVTVSESAVWRLVLEARRALGDDLQRVIVTVRGRGFRFAATVVESEAGTKAAPFREPSGGDHDDPTLVGRQACVVAIGSRMTQALAGRGGAVWLSGEAGIGKTRIADDTARRARARGALVLSALAHDVPDAPPYVLWTELIHTLARDADDVARELRTRVTQALSGEDARADGARFALFDTVCRAFGEASRARPIVVILEDLHRADEPSLHLLEHFVHKIRDHAMMLLGTCRDGVPPGDARARQLGGLFGQADSVHIPLRKLSPADVAQLVEIQTGMPSSPPLARAVAERSGGNPFYVKEVLKTEWAERALATQASELATSMDLEQGIIETIFRHLDTLTEQAREVLTLAAVLGREFETMQLGVVSGLAVEPLMDALDEGRRAHLLQHADRRYAFNHMLVRDVLYKRLSTSQRSAYHRSVGEKLLDHYGEATDAHAAELAGHFVRALPLGDPEQAIDLSMRAAKQATTFGRPRDAARLWQQAAYACTMLAGDDARRASVQLALAQARLAAGMLPEAKESFLDAAVLGKTFAHAEQMAEAALGYAALAGPEDAQRRALLEQARGVLGDKTDGASGALRERLVAALDEGKR